MSLKASCCVVYVYWHDTSVHTPGPDGKGWFHHFNLKTPHWSSSSWYKQRKRTSCFARMFIFSLFDWSKPEQNILLNMLFLLTHSMRIAVIKIDYRASFRWTIAECHRLTFLYMHLFLFTTSSMKVGWINNDLHPHSENAWSSICFSISVASECFEFISATSKTKVVCTTLLWCRPWVLFLDEKRFDCLRKMRTKTHETELGSKDSHMVCEYDRNNASQRQLKIKVSTLTLRVNFSINVRISVTVEIRWGPIFRLRTFEKRSYLPRSSPSWLVSPHGPHPGRRATRELGGV